ncbi:MAG: pilus assembly protein PilP [Dokdonella sp.]
MAMLRVILTGAVLLSAVGLAGCSSGDADLREWIAQQKLKKGPPLDPIPVPKTFETFEYREAGRRDPFSPSASEQEELVSSGPRPDENRPHEPLESFPMDGLKMMGTLGKGNNLIVLVRDPDNVIHRVRRGNYMGQNNGRITVLAEDHLDLVELVSNGNGGWMERPVSLVLGDATQ